MNGEESTYVYTYYIRLMSKASQQIVHCNSRNRRNIGAHLLIMYLIFAKFLTTRVYIRIMFFHFMYVKKIGNTSPAWRDPSFSRLHLLLLVYRSVNHLVYCLCTLERVLNLPFFVLHLTKKIISWK